ncbi:MAG: hypothetical protein ABI068_12195, partial [Ktedonobacterales bacterium]
SVPASEIVSTPPPVIVPVLTPIPTQALPAISQPELSKAPDVTPAPEQPLQSVQPLPMSRPAREQQAEEGAQPAPAAPSKAHAHVVAAPLLHSRNPRVIAALCYAVPFLPALATLCGLLGERRNRFIRTHAIQSLLFFAALAGIQITLFIAVVALGATLPVDQFGMSVALGLLFYSLTIGVGIGAFLLWTALIGDALSGQMRLHPLLTSAAILLERWTAAFDHDQLNRHPIRRRLWPTQVE